MEVDWEMKHGFSNLDGTAIERITVLNKKINKMAEEEPWLEVKEIEETDK